MNVRTLSRIALASVLALWFIVALTGCQRAAERVVEQSTGVSVDQDGDQITITGPEGEEWTGGTGGALPQGWPDDHPVYEPSEIEASTSFSTGEGTQQSVTLSTGDPFETVFDWYKSEAAAQGWAIESEGLLEMDGVSSGYLYLGKGDIESSISINQDGDDDVVVTMVVGFP